VLFAPLTQPDTPFPDPGNSQSLNRYSYGYNNPVKYNDPTGHCPDDYVEDEEGKCVPPPEDDECEGSDAINCEIGMENLCIQGGVGWNPDPDGGTASICDRLITDGIITEYNYWSNLRFIVGWGLRDPEKAKEIHYNLVVTYSWGSASGNQMDSDEKISIETIIYIDPVDSARVVENSMNAKNILVLIPSNQNDFYSRMELAGATVATIPNTNHSTIDDSEVTYLIIKIWLKSLHNK